MLRDKGWSGTRYDRLIILKKRIGKQSASTNRCKSNQYHDPPQNVTRIHDLP